MNRNQSLRLLAGMAAGLGSSLQKGLLASATIPVSQARQTQRHWAWMGE